MITVVDQIGQEHHFTKTPQRIISLVPSQTELLVDLGLLDDIVGITKFCVHPKDIRKQKISVGGTKQVDVDKITSLAPDIILCNKEENTKEIVEQLSHIAPVHVSDVATLDDATSLISEYGKLFNKEAIAQDIVSEISKKLKDFKLKNIDLIKRKCLYLIWQKPYMTVGKDTFINYLLELNGFESIINKNRYPEVTVEQLKIPEYILLSSEPFPFKEKHREEIQEKTSANIILVDGEYFSWYGSRLLGAFDYFLKLTKVLAEFNP